MQTLGEGSNVYHQLGTFFRQADARYNSGLFHFRTDDGLAESLDNFTLQLSIDDKILKTILRGLYYPESPYEFSVIPALLLGQVSAEHADLAVRDLTRRPRVLTSDATGGLALLEKPGLIQNKNRILIGQGLQRIFAHDVAQRVSVPRSSTQNGLLAPGTGIARRFRTHPAGLAPLSPT